MWCMFPAWHNSCALRPPWSGMSLCLRPHTLRVSIWAAARLSRRTCSWALGGEQLSRSPLEWGSPSVIHLPMQDENRNSKRSVPGEARQSLHIRQSGAPSGTRQRSRCGSWHQQNISWAWKAARPGLSAMVREERNEPIKGISLSFSQSLKLKIKHRTLWTTKNTSQHRGSTPTAVHTHTHAHTRSGWVGTWPELIHAEHCEYRMTQIKFYVIVIIITCMKMGLCPYWTTGIKHPELLKIFASQSSLDKNRSSCMDLESVTQSEVKSEREKQIPYANTYIWHLKKKKVMKNLGAGQE